MVICEMTHMNCIAQWIVLNIWAIRAIPTIVSLIINFSMRIIIQDESVKF
jgi:hypothetical protein